MTLIRDAPANGRALNTHWRRWLAENLMLRVSVEAIVETLGRHGFDAATARTEISAVRTDPCYQAGDWMAQRLRKLECLLDVHRDLQQLDGGWTSVDRCFQLSRRAFLERYYARNRPVVLPGLAANWPAHALWTPTYLKEHYGHAVVEVMCDREADDKYEQNAEKHKRTMRFGEYIDRVCRTGTSNDLYLVANNHFFEQPDTGGLWNDVRTPTEYLDDAATRGKTFFWFGPAGTVTPLHHDVVNVLFVQLYGRKGVTLIPSLQTHRTYNDVGVYSRVDLRADAPRAHPLFAETCRMEVCVEPGDALLIPVGWWHHVEALDVSISVSMTNFVFPNDYRWNHPEIRR
jgi:ribosomal protein L16 Arg81 hydroxylase